MLRNVAISALVQRPQAKKVRPGRAGGGRTFGGPNDRRLLVVATQPNWPFGDVRDHLNKDVFVGQGARQLEIGNGDRAIAIGARNQLRLQRDGKRSAPHDGGAKG